MSDSFIRLIPTSPEFVPAEAARIKAMQLVKAEICPQGEVKERVTENVEFIDQGANFETVSCPFCDKELETKWWQEAMEKAYESRFKSLDVTMPCCKKRTSLNDLTYVFPAGFARFVIDIRDQGQKIAKDFQIDLEKILECTLRVIWRKI